MKLIKIELTFFLPEYLRVPYLQIYYDPLLTIAAFTSSFV